MSPHTSFCLMLAVSIAAPSCKPRIDRSELREGLDFLNAKVYDPKFVTNLSIANATMGVANASFPDPLNRWIYVAYNEGKIGLWDQERDILMATWQVQGAGDVTSIAVGAQFDKRLIAVGDRQGKIFFGYFDISSKTPNFVAAQSGMKGGVTGIGVSAFGDFVVAGALSAEVRFWSFEKAFDPNGPIWSREALPDRGRKDSQAPRDANGNLLKDRRAALAINKLVLLEDNSFLVARDGDIEWWNPVTMIPTSLPGSDAVINGQKIGRISALGAVAARSSNCSRSEATVAAGEANGRILFLKLMLSSDRWPVSPQDEKLAELLAEYKRIPEPGTGVSSSNNGTGIIDVNRMRPKVMTNCNETGASAEPRFQLISSFNSENQKTPWAIDPAKIKSAKGHTNSITDISFSQDSSKMITASLDGTIAIWDLKSQRMLRKLIIPNGSISTASFSDEDSRVYYTQSGGGKLFSWNQAAMHSLSRVESNGGVAASFSQDGAQFALATENKSIKLRKTYGADGWLGERELIAEAISENLVSSLMFVPRDPSDADDTELISAQCDGTVTAWRIDGRSLVKKTSLDINSVTAQLGGQVDLSSSFVNSCNLFSPEARIVLGIGTEDGTRKLVVSYPTTGRSGVVVFNLATMVPEVAHPYPPSPEMQKTSLRPNQLLIKGESEIIEIRSFDQISSDKSILNVPIPDLYPVRFFRKSRNGVVSIAALTKSNVSRAEVGKAGEVSAMAVGQSSDLLAYGGGNRLLTISRISDKRQKFTIPQNPNEKGASVPGLARDLAISKDGIAVMAAENGVFLVWASEVYTHNLF